MHQHIEHHPAFEDRVDAAKSFTATFQNRRSFVMLFTLFVLFFIVGIIAYFYQQLSTHEPTTYEECITQPTSTAQYSFPPTCISKSGNLYTKLLTPEEKQLLTPNPSPALPAGWQSYQNEQYGITLSYPPEWEMLGYRETQMFRDGDLVQFRIVGPTQKDATEFYDGATVTLAIPQALNGQSYNDYINSYHKTSPETSVGPTIGTRTINGKTWTHIYVCGLGCYDYYHILYNDLVYGIVTYVGGADENTYAKQVETLVNSLQLGTITAHPPPTISWDEAVNQIKTCNVVQITQTHSLDVYLSLKGGHNVKTEEPAIDDVFAVVHEARTTCGNDVTIATE